MIRWTRKAQIAPGKFVQAVQFAKEIAELGKKISKSPSVSVYLDTFGEVGTIRWFADFEDFAAWEKVANQLFANQEYLQKVNQAADLFIQGSASDTIMRAI
jgi:hypothetical protein